MLFRKKSLFFSISLEKQEGYCHPAVCPPHAAIQELRVTVRVLPPQDCMLM